jgi:hypothetical protein
VFRTLWLVIVLTTLLESRLTPAQNQQILNPKVPCAPPENCIETGKEIPAAAAQGAEADPKSLADKKLKNKQRKKSDNVAKRSTTTEQAIGERAPALGPKKLANPECPGPYGPFTPTYCLEGAHASEKNPTMPQRARPTPAAKSAESKLEIPAASAALAENGAVAGNDADSLSKEELFGLSKPEGSQKGEPKPIEWHGFVQNETAYTYADPAHWSRGVVRTQLGAQGGGSDLKWKATVRLDADPVYYGTDFYPQAVRKDQRLDFFVRETYIDTSVGNVELRLGKQNIVWGEMVGLFFADVVSATDQRDFVLPDFEIIRIPQWAMRAEYFGEKSHVEIIWLPYPDINNIGKPGAEFYPLPAAAPPGFSQQIDDEVRPGHGLQNSNYGARMSTLRNGWDVSAFYYRSTDVNPTFYRDVTLSPTPTLVFTPLHDRIGQAGATLAKDLGSVVLKAETVYASGRHFNVTRLTEPTGVVPQNTLDYVLGLDFTLPRETRLNLQYFERVFFDHDPDLLQDRRESGVSLLLSGKIGATLEPELLVIQSVNRNDRLVRPKLGWIPEKNWRVTFGVDVFTGPVTGYFGRFSDRDRAYLELRFDY